MPATAPFYEAVKILKGLGTDVLIAFDEAGLPIGTIIRVHRRYWPMLFGIAGCVRVGHDANAGGANAQC